MNAFLTRHIEGIAGRSDHRIEREDDERAENMALYGLIAFVILGAVLKVTGLL